VSGTSFNGRFEKRGILRHGYFMLSGSRGYNESFRNIVHRGFSYFYRADLTAGYAVTRRFTIYLSGLYRFNQYLEQIPGVPEREEIYKTGSVGARHQIKSWISVLGEFSTRNLDSNFDIFDYSENRFYLGIEMSPETPYRSVR